MVEFNIFFVFLHWCFLVAFINALWWIFGVKKSFMESLPLAFIIEMLLQAIRLL